MKCTLRERRSSRETITGQRAARACGRDAGDTELKVRYRGIVGRRSCFDHSRSVNQVPSLPERDPDATNSGFQAQNAVKARSRKLHEDFALSIDPSRYETQAEPRYEQEGRP